MTEILWRAPSLAALLDAPVGSIYERAPDSPEWIPTEGPAPALPEVTEVQYLLMTTSAGLPIVLGAVLGLFFGAFLDNGVFHAAFCAGVGFLLGCPFSAALYLYHRLAR